MGAGTQRSPLTPNINGLYTFVTISATGAKVYVNGVPWASFPSVQWGVMDKDASGNFYVPGGFRFYGGNLATTNIAIHDLQFYDYVLTPSQVHALSRGNTAAC